MKLIVQIPCYNESETLKNVLDEIPSSIPGITSIETLVIDDGSVDGTAALAQQLGVSHVIRHNRNRGLAAAFSTGLDACLRLGADVIVNTDGDNQYPGRYIPDLLRPIINHEADFVLGDRRPDQNGAGSPAKRIGYRVGRIVVSALAGRSIPDPVSGFRAISREAAEQMVIVTSYSYTLETIMHAVHTGLAIDFVPIEVNPPTRPSRLFRSLTGFCLRSGITLLRVFFMYRALQVLLVISAALAAIGSLPIIRFLWLYSQGDGEGHLQSIVLGATLLVLATVALFSGLLADLIAHNRMFHQQMHRGMQRESRVDTDRRMVPNGS